MSKLTMKEVALHAGVALSSVSRVLNGHDDVSEKMRQKVLNTCDELGYEPNLLASSLRSGTTRTVGFLISAISNPLLERVSLEGTKGLLLNITGGSDMSLQEVSEAADRIKQEIEDNARIIFGSSINKELDGMMRVSIIATGIGNVVDINKKTFEEKIKKEENLFQDPTKKIIPKFS